ncbi:MAG: acyltransferase 3 protein [Devosia sp.]|uniref:acyltransferase family protein n=1 Tax=Devosia sp. TaxID=1871048 RepID=UPI002613AF57|nr:acyltransferase [Devosia sp.]MDB5540513.1 acyltransferase 3 protein [Devosia sp.]
MVGREIIAPLHGLRGIAAMTVVLGHVGDITKVLVISPACGVLLFFSLSGYLMMHLYGAATFSLRSAWSFAVARFARIYPLFAAVIVANVMLDIWLGKSPFQFGVDQLAPHLLLAGAGLTVWTVSVECQFYGLFLIAWIAHQTVFRKNDAAFAAFLVAGLGVLWMLGLQGGRIDILHYLHLFVLGMLAAIVMRKTGGATMVRIAGWAAIPLAASYLAICLYYAPVFAPGQRIFSEMWVSVVVAGLVGALAMAPKSLAGRVLGSAPLVWLGEISFGIYLLQRPVMFFLAAVPGLNRYTWAALVILLTILAAWVAHLSIERPARYWIRRGSVQPLSIPVPTP